MRKITLSLCALLVCGAGCRPISTTSEFFQYEPPADLHARVHVDGAELAIHGYAVDCASTPARIALRSSAFILKHERAGFTDLADDLSNVLYIEFDPASIGVGGLVADLGDSTWGALGIDVEQLDGATTPAIASGTGATGSLTLVSACGRGLDTGAEATGFFAGDLLHPDGNPFTVLGDFQLGATGAQWGQETIFFSAP